MNQWTDHLEEYEIILQKMQKIAAKFNYKLNPDKERVEKVIGLMTENFVAEKKYFCPCKQTHPLDPSVDVTCPCPQWKEEIKNDGHCFCKLFFKQEE